jgi:mono/diheme cytochrome c family protein
MSTSSSRTEIRKSWSGRALAGGLILVGTLISCAGTQTPKDRITDPGEMLFNGQVVTTIDCYRCHNGDGTGTWKGANLAERVPRLTDGALIKTINEGPGRMPGYKGKIDDQQMAALTAWLRGRFPTKTP